MPSQRKGVRLYKAIALTSLMSKWCATCVILRLVKKKHEGWKRLHVGGIGGISCQHLQVLMTQLLQKQEWQEERKEEHGVVRQQRDPRRGKTETHREHLW